MLVAASVAGANMVAITEFVNNPEGQDSGREWVELFNYGPNAIDLTGWTLVDEDTDSYAFPAGTTIGAGDYIVLVSPGSTPDLTPAQAKAVFEQEWLGGVADARVLGMTAFATANSGDELVLKNGAAETVWNIAYDNDENDHATWLTVNDFSRTDWGTKEGVQIDRAGDDLGIVGLLGYERNDGGTNDDPFAYASDFEAIKDGTFLTGIGLAADYYSSSDIGIIGSPLQGIYVPEPVSLALLALGGVVLLRRK
jgi:hypothetical protein